MHGTATESAWHAITGEWYIALPLYIIILFAITAAIYLASKSKATAFNTLLVILFIAGIGFYSVAPVVSIVSLAGGFGMALAIVIMGLGGKSGNSKKGRK